MRSPRRFAFVLAALVAVALASPAWAQQAQTKPYEPQVGQEGKDVVWVPTPQVLVDQMLDLAKLTPGDFVIDLGSGDGRTVITAAKRGARAHGIEYNPDMVALAKKNAAEAGVSDRATFEKADLFESDFSRAQVITMFLLPSINMKLRPTLLDLAPGTRIVSNSFSMEDWTADETAEVEEDCTSWCTALLWIVPAKVAGTWRMPQGTLQLTQEFQHVGGTLGEAPVRAGKLRGAELSFTVGNVIYTGRVDGNTMRGTMTGGGPWTATRQ
ncbi:MAG: class I SAM-dependent methyltransferase [Vicinamibacterales bacterium]|nr:class I SAM-dependent methyltransferase [Vicinamibacterales bacterium]